MKNKGHYREFFNCLQCNKRTNINLSKCSHCGFSTPKDQKDYHFTRSRLVNHKRIKTLGRLVKEYSELAKKYPDMVPSKPLFSFKDNFKFEMKYFLSRLKNYFQ